MVLISLGLVLVAALIGIYYIYSYWKRKGFPHLRPTFPYGNLETFRKKEKSFSVSIADLHHKSKEPFFGIYMFFRPALMIRDADLVKKVLADDFDHFHDRGVHSNEKVNPMSANLFNLEGKNWRDMRSKISPTFTSGKLKKMFGTIENVGNLMQEHLEHRVQKGGTIVELKDITTRYSIDIIVSTFFGCEINSFNNNDHIFTEIRESSLGKGFIRNLAMATAFLAPKLFEWLQLYRIQVKEGKKMIAIVKDTIDFREKHDIQRKDFMQLLMQYRNTGMIKDDDDWDAKPATKDGIEALSIEQIAAQAFVFFLAGQETTAGTISFCLYELAQNKEIMEKLIADIKQALQHHNGEITYDSIMEMKYLDLVLMETLRKYPALPMLNRECTKDYQIPGSKFRIEKGIPIVISMLGLHRDAEYFPDPMRFDPDRFVPGNTNYNSNAYIPFGEGPRMCIGFRQGKLSTKVAIVKMLTKFKMEAIEKKEIEFDNYSLTLIPKGGLNVKLTKICN